MPDSERNPERFADLLNQVIESAHLTEHDIGAAAGRSRSQVNQWRHGNHLPEYPALRKLTDFLAAEYEGLGTLPAELLVAAGYGELAAHAETVATPARGFCVDLGDENERLLWKLEAPRRTREAMVALWRLIRAPGAADDLDRRLDEAQYDGREERRRA